MSEYQIRPFESADRDGFLDLYHAVMGGPRDPDWFEWKYTENPYVDHVPMLVTADGDDIVGARPFFALPIAINQSREIALQPGDTMVHPEHRRQGLFTRMTERSIERYAGECPFFFNFPNHRSRPGYLKLDWEIVNEQPVHYRIENPAVVATSQSDRTAVRVAGTIAAPATRAYYKLRSFGRTIDEDRTIRRTEEVPGDELLYLYRQAVPDQIHAERDEQFYRWRFENPQWSYSTFLAEGPSGPEAAIVTGTRTEDSGLRTTRLCEVVPLDDPPEAILGDLINRILEDHADTDLFAAPTEVIPNSVLRSYGFRPDDARPLSSLTETTTHVVRTLNGGWKIHGVDITQAENWTMTFLERDNA